MQSIFCCHKDMTSHSRRGMFEGAGGCTDPTEMTAEYNRKRYTSYQKSARGDQISEMKESSHHLLKSEPQTEKEKRQYDTSEPYKMQETSKPDGPFQEGSGSYQGQRATYDPYKITPYKIQETIKPDGPFQEGSMSYQGQRATYDPYKITPYKIQETIKPDGPFQEGSVSYQGQYDTSEPYKMQETSKPDGPFQEGSGSYQGQHAKYDPYKITPYKMQETSKPDGPFQEGSRSYQGQMDSKGRGLSGSVNSQPEVPGSLHRQYDTSEPYKMQETSKPDGPFQEGSGSYQGQHAKYDPYKITPYKMQETSKPDGPFQEGSRSYQGQMDSKGRGLSGSVNSQPEVPGSLHRQYDTSEPYKMQETSKPDGPFQEGSGSYQGQHAKYDPYKITPYKMQETSKPDGPFQEGSRSYQGQMDSKGRGLSGSVNSQPEVPGSLHRQYDTSEPYKMQETSKPDGPFQEGSGSYPGETSPALGTRSSLTLKVQKFLLAFGWYFLCLVLCPMPLVLSLGTTEKVWPQPPDTHPSRIFKHRALPVGVTQAELQEKQEAKALKARQKRNTLLSSKMISMHQRSENMNDPLRLSAVLNLYEMLRLQGWAKLKFSQDPSMSYKDASILIKELFNACEKDVEQRTNSIFELLDNPPLNDAETKRKQESIQEIRRLLRDFCYQNNSELYSKIVMQAGIDAKSASLKEFTHQCCQVYIFLLLQEPPVKAVWHEQGISKTYSEHVIKKDCSEWRKAEFLWPVMKRGEEVIVKGVVWD
ncbi:uncharacterized protein LOC115598199 isoform X2 [Calypte anna]|uniref:uncharacterized protein LOC115598199 isoform X2 n=1 Tax=Calypte anna TaxID=9244 RepID=UPI0011C478FE|nr:uncharacterized protein LOC115598199 isoform X2 [Calypte anna]